MKMNVIMNLRKLKTVEEAREQELLVLRRVRSQQKRVKDEPSSSSPTHPITKTLTQNFCHLIPEEKPIGGEPLLEAPNYVLRAFEEVVQSKSKKSPTYTIQTSKGKV